MLIIEQHMGWNAIGERIQYSALTVFNLHVLKLYATYVGTK